MNLRHLTGSSLFVATQLVIAPDDAYAYLDPGTGSYMLQIVLGVMLGAAFAIKVFWFRIRAFFGGLFSRKSRGR